MLRHVKKNYTDKPPKAIIELIPPEERKKVQKNKKDQSSASAILVFTYLIKYFELL